MNRHPAGTLALFLFFASTLSAADFGTVPDPYVGNWSGTLSAHGREEPIHATIIAYKSRYEITLRTEPNPRKEALVILGGTIHANQLLLDPALSRPQSQGRVGSGRSAAAEGVRWQGQANSQDLTGTFAGPATGSFALKKIPLLPSPTLGAEAPAGAEVLLAGSNLNAWESRRASAEPIQWSITKSGALEVVSESAGIRNKQDLKTKGSFVDYRLHLEFKLAHKPEATGQGRSNSGVIHLGQYETQILDSFGLYGRDNDCGGIYKIREPDSNAAYPAGLWQTYDFDFTAPRFDAAGTKTADARITVRLNGILVHRDVAIPKPTAGGKETARGPIVLQDHGNPVQFRNIWVVRMNEKE